jgi:small subunit ribosomal protein S4
MGNYTGPKVKLSRSLGVPIAETNKHLSPRKQNRPGAHGFRRGRPSLYSRQLAEKQKMARYYNVRDGQLRRSVERASSMTGDNTANLQRILETRLDNVVRRLGWARTIWQARQAVSHGHFRVNGHKVDRPSFEVKPGDAISVRDKSQKFVRECAESCEGLLAGEWLKVDMSKLEGEVVRYPVPEDIRLPFELEASLIIEYYTR